MKKLGILLSGSGSTYANIVDEINAGRLDAEIAIVISSKEGAYGLTRAKEYGHKNIVTKDEKEITAEMIKAGVDFIIMCGYMNYYDPDESFIGKTVNIHPSLIPSFCGKGMYGRNVHEAVMEKGCKVSGCTVHLVQGDYDTGPILAQEIVKITKDDTAETLQDKVQALERETYPKVIQELILGSVK